VPVTINLKERDGAEWDRDAECAAQIPINLLTWYSGTILCPGDNTVSFQVEPVALSSQAEMYFVLRSITIASSFDGGPGNDGEYCAFVEVNGVPLTSAYDCTSTLEAGYVHSIPEGQGYSVIPFDGQQSATLTIRLRELDSGWDVDADCAVSITVTQGSPQRIDTIDCPGKNGVEYAVGPDLDALLHSRPPPNSKGEDPRNPVIQAFTASPASVAAGTPSTLSWQVTCGGCDISLAGQNLSESGLPPAGSRVVSPTSTWEWVLRAELGDSKKRAAVTISVQPTVPPPPTEPSTPYDFLVICESGSPGSCARCSASQCKTQTQSAISEDLARAAVQSLNGNCTVDKISPAEVTQACDTWKMKCLASCSR
jgi:hypothetical protein